MKTLTCFGAKAVGLKEKLIPTLSLKPRPPIPIPPSPDLVSYACRTGARGVRGHELRSRQGCSAAVKPQEKPHFLAPRPGSCGDCAVLVPAAGGAVSGGSGLGPAPAR